VPWSVLVLWFGEEGMIGGTGPAGVQDSDLIPYSKPLSAPSFSIRAICRGVIITRQRKQSGAEAGPCPADETLAKRGWSTGCLVNRLYPGFAIRTIHDGLSQILQGLLPGGILVIVQVPGREDV